MENFDKKYKDVLRKATKIHRDDNEEIKHYMEVLFPELKDEDDRIRKELTEFLKSASGGVLDTTIQCKTFGKWLAWLEKQVSIDENEVAKRVLIEVSDSIMRWLDANCAEGNMCLSNMECEDIENAVRNANWQMIYGYMKKKLEKQCEQKVSAVEFNAKDWYVSKVDGKIYNAKFMEKPHTNQTRKLEIEKAAMSATGIIEREEWFIKGAEWADENPSYISSEKQGEQKTQAKSAIEIWKDMRLEVYQQASGNRHESNYSDDTTKMFSLNDIDEIIEKISEQKPADKVEPKFHKGDWVLNNVCLPVQIASVKDGLYIFTEGDAISVSFVDENFHLWTIQDARDGDVLVSLSNQPFIYNGECNTFHVGSYCGMDCIGRKFIISQEKCHWTERNGIKPATKKQREQLEKAMADAGYKWDAEKKELKKIEQPKLTEFEEAVKDMMDDYRDAIGDNDATVEEVKEHAAYLLSLIPCKSTAWSEEDERNMQNIDSVLFYDKVLPEDTCVKLRNFLKSIKQRIGE